VEGLELPLERDHLGAGRVEVAVDRGHDDDVDRLGSSWIVQLGMSPKNFWTPRSGAALSARSVPSVRRLGTAGASRTPRCRPHR
jgi:hypothetical protein